VELLNKHGIIPDHGRRVGRRRSPRAGYYEGAGVLRDMFQNHLFPAPVPGHGAAISSRRTPSETKNESMAFALAASIVQRTRHRSFRVQYAGMVRVRFGKMVPAYRCQEPGVKPGRLRKPLPLFVSRGGELALVWRSFILLLANGCQNARPRFRVQFGRTCWPLILQTVDGRSNFIERPL